MRLVIKKIEYTIVLICMMCTSVKSQTITDEVINDWKGFKKIEFKLNGIPAYYLVPKKSIDGTPWVWRAHFPEWHTEMDEILLEKGFHIAYINTNDLLGAPNAMNIWDDFYDYLTLHKNFSSQVVLEGVSRGGLYIYNWAKRNPDKVSLIYGEAPVCDFNSWPGNAENEQENWNKLLELYNLTEEGALNFKDQAKDNLEGLASFKVPILHVVSLTDKIVPVNENTLPLVNNYIKAGGIASVFPMYRGKQSLQGHHFPIEYPERLAEIIYSYVVPVDNRLKSSDYIYNYGSLDNFLCKLQNKKEVTVAFYGGSITYMNGWRNKTMQYFRELFPNVTFNFINAGIPSLGSVPHSFRMNDDLLDKGNIDLMFLESAVNDKTNDTPEKEQRRAFEGIIRQALKFNPFMNIITMAFVDEDKIADYSNGLIPKEIRVHDEISNHYNMPFINLAKEVTDRIINNEFTWEYDFKDVHPATIGQEIYFSTIKTLLKKELKYKTINDLKAEKIPKPLLKSNYENGNYVSIDEAAVIRGFTKIKSWRADDNLEKREGFVDVPILEGSIPGSELIFKFNGNAIGLSVISGADTGIIIYSIDDAEEQTIDLHTRWSNHLYLPWYVVLSDNLKRGNHTLKLRISEKQNKMSSGNAVRIFKFLLN